MLRTLAASFLLLCTAGVSPGSTDAVTPARKPPEVSTVGTTPAVFTDADRAKLAEVERRFAAARRLPQARVVTAAAAGEKREVSTRIPAGPVRNRLKPGQAAQPAKSVPVPVKTTTTTASPAKGGRP